MSLKAIATYFAIGIAALLIGELLARGYGWSPRMNVGVVSDSLGVERYYHSYEGYGDLVPNQDGHWVIWFHRPYHVQTNSIGLRNTEEPMDRAFRIYALGDSQTFGPYLANDDTWPAWTENYLRQKLGRADTVQVFNAGISGYTIRDELALLQDKGVAFKPNLVLLAVYENDLGDLSKPPQRPGGGVNSRLTLLIKKLARASALASLANELRTSMQLSAAGVDIRAGERAAAGGDKTRDDKSNARQRYGELFRAMVDLLKKNDIPLAVIFIPDVDVVTNAEASEMVPIAKALSGDSQVPFLDLTDVVRNAPDPAAHAYLLQHDVGSGRLTGNGHLSRQGTAIIGKAIADWLLEQGLVPASNK